MYDKTQLTPGCTIGIFSSSRPITAEYPKATQCAARYLRSRGYRVKFGALTGKEECVYRSGSILERAREFNDLIHDDSVQCLMASAGGFVSNSILPYLDYEYLREHPKIIVGHSDITSLLLGIYAQTNINTYYGPNFITSLSLPEKYASISLESLERATCNGLYAYDCPPFYCDTVSWDCTTESAMISCEKTNHYKTVSGGMCEGRLIGGNLSTLCSLIGSPYMPEIRDGDILFLEEIGGSPDFCERFYSQLALNGIFNKIGGLILGKHKGYDSLGTQYSEIQILLEVLRERRFPILADFDCGHTVPILTLPIGRTARMDADKQRIELL